MLHKRKPSHLAVARLSRHVTAEVLKESSQEVNFPGNFGLNAPRETLKEASSQAIKANGEFAQECYPRVAGICWQAIVVAHRATREAKDLKAKERWVREEVRKLEDAIETVEAKIDTIVQLVSKVQERYGEASSAAAFMANGKPHIVQAVSSRRACLNLAKQDIQKGDWIEAERHILLAREAEREADYLLKFANQLIDGRFYKRARVRKNGIVRSVRPAA